jgi:hypothetical protein
MVRPAVQIRDETRDGQTKTLTARQLHSIMAASNLVALVEFWQSLKRLGTPDDRATSLHAEGILREMAEFSYADTRGIAFSPHHAEALRYCGLEPIRIAAPGECIC